MFSKIVFGVAIALSGLSAHAQYPFAKVIKDQYVTVLQDEEVEANQYYVSGENFEKKEKAYFSARITSSEGYKCSKVSGNMTIALTLVTRDLVFTGTSFDTVVGAPDVLQVARSGCFPLDNNVIEFRKILEPETEDYPTVFLTTRIRTTDLDGVKIISEVEFLREVEGKITERIQFQTNAYPKQAQHGILETLKNDQRFTTLVSLIQLAGLEFAISGDNYTLFAPTNEAFAKLPAETVKSLLLFENRYRLRAILLNHLVGKRLDAASVVALALSGNSVVSLSKKLFNFNVDGGTVFIKNVFQEKFKVIETDKNANTSVIHVLDDVITRL